MARRYGKRSLVAGLLLLAIGIVRFVSDGGHGETESTPRQRAGDDALIEAAFEQERSDVDVRFSGTVSRTLSDDNQGSRHQRFIVELASGHTVLIAHNIDLAPKVPLTVGDRVEISGEYEWNDRGGVVHWTHHDPQGRREGGWIRHEGELYE